MTSCQWHVTSVTYGVDFVAALEQSICADWRKKRLSNRKWTVWSQTKLFSNEKSEVFSKTCLQSCILRDTVNRSRVRGRVWLPSVTSAQPVQWHCEWVHNVDSWSDRSVCNVQYYWHILQLSALIINNPAIIFVMLLIIQFYKPDLIQLLQGVLRRMHTPYAKQSWKHAQCRIFA